MALGLIGFTGLSGVWAFLFAHMLGNIIDLLSCFYAALATKTTVNTAPTDRLTAAPGTKGFRV